MALRLTPQRQEIVRRMATAGDLLTSERISHYKPQYFVGVRPNNLYVQEEDFTYLLNKALIIMVDRDIKNSTSRVTGQTSSTINLIYGLTDLGKQIANGNPRKVQPKSIDTPRRTWGSKQIEVLREMAAGKELTISIASGQKGGYHYQLGGHSLDYSYSKTIESLEKNGYIKTESRKLGQFQWEVKLTELGNEAIRILNEKE